MRYLDVTIKVGLAVDDDADLTEEAIAAEVTEVIAAEGLDPCCVDTWRTAYEDEERECPPVGRARQPEPEPEAAPTGPPPEITAGQVARALAHRPAPRNLAPGVVWLGHRHDGSDTHDCFDWWVRDHGRELCFVVHVFRNRHAEDGGAA